MLPDELIELICTYLPIKILFKLRNYPIIGDIYDTKMNIITPKYKQRGGTPIYFDSKMNLYYFERCIKTGDIKIINFVNDLLENDEGNWYRLNKEKLDLDKIPTPNFNLVNIDSGTYELIDGKCIVKTSYAKRSGIYLEGIVYMDKDGKSLITLNKEGVLRKDRIVYPFPRPIIDYIIYDDGIIILDNDHNMYLLDKWNGEGRQRPDEFHLLKERKWNGEGRQRSKNPYRLIDTNIHKLISANYSGVYAITRNGYLKLYSHYAGIGIIVAYDYN